MLWREKNHPFYLCVIVCNIIKLSLSLSLALSQSLILNKKRNNDYNGN